MTTTTENLYVGDGSTVLYSFTFPYIDTTDVKVSLDGLDVTTYTLANATTVELNAAPNSGVSIRIYRQTPTDSISAEFFPGSAIRAQDLNDNFEQTLYIVQESQSIIENSDAASVTAIANQALTTANQASNTANAIAGTANAAVTTANAAEVTANQALSDAIAANSTAASAQAAANTAQAAANTAQTTANAAFSPTGSVTMFAGAAVPAGWLECNGQVAPASLAAVLGQANVPDLRGEFIRGWDNGRGVDTGRILGSAQASTATRQTMNEWTGNDNNATSGYGIGQQYASADSEGLGNYSGTRKSGNGTNSPTPVNDNLSDGGQENSEPNADNWITYRPRNVALMYIIKT